MRAVTAWTRVRWQDLLTLIAALRLARQLRGWRDDGVRIALYDDDGRPLRQAGFKHMRYAVLAVRWRYLLTTWRAIPPLMCGATPEECVAWHRRHPRLSRHLALRLLWITL